MNFKFYELAKDIVELDQQLEDIALQYGCKEGPEEIALLKFLSQLLQLINTIRLECAYLKDNKNPPKELTILWDEKNECWKLKQK